MAWIHYRVNYSTVKNNYVYNYVYILQENTISLQYLKIVLKEILTPDFAQTR